MKVYNLVIFDPDCGEMSMGFYTTRASAYKKLKQIEKTCLSDGNTIDEDEYEIVPVPVHK